MTTTRRILLALLPALAAVACGSEREGLGPRGTALPPPQPEGAPPLPPSGR